LQDAVDTGGRVEEVDGPLGRFEPRHRQRVGEGAYEQCPDGADRRDFIRQQARSRLVAIYQKHDPYSDSMRQHQRAQFQLLTNTWTAACPTIGIARIFAAGGGAHTGLVKAASGEKKCRYEPILD